MLEFEKSKMCIIRSAFITMYWIMLHCHSQGCHSNPDLATLNYIYIYVSCIGRVISCCPGFWVKVKVTILKHLGKA